ncbi:MAG: anti-sigma factor family protein [Bryobacteraceae bacterium]
MNCSQFDLKGYLLGELPERDRSAVADHAAGCTACAEEIDRLRLTHVTMMTLGEEELPRRIAFVSDKVFEPRWWQRVWISGPKLGFASAAMLSAAILGHGFVASPGRPVDQAQLETVVRKVVAESESRQQARLSQAMSAVGESYEVLMKKVNVQLTAFRRGAL